MSGTIRFSWHRPGGWGRLGLAASVAALFGTPMLWAVGAFGDGEDALRRAMIFLFSGLWLGVAVGYTVGWAMRGFFARVKETDEDEDHHPHPPAGRPPARH